MIPDDLTLVTIPLIISRIARKALPVRLRVRLRSSRLVRKVAANVLGGVTHCEFPDSHLKLYFDGYRHIGFGLNISSLEQREKALVGRIIRTTSPRVVWDIGANIGTWSLFFSSLCAEFAEIRCFEPDPENLEFLSMNQEKNNLSNWVIRPFAISNKEGSTTFFADPVCGATGSLEDDHDFIGKYYHADVIAIQVKTTTVDAEISSGALPPQLIKIDVEGHELEVLEGAQNTLRYHRPCLLFEATRNHSKISEILRTLEYKLFDLDGKRIEEPQFNTIALPSESPFFN